MKNQAVLIVLVLVMYHGAVQARDSFVIIRSAGDIGQFYYHDSLGYGHPLPIRKGDNRIILSSPTILFHASPQQTPFYIAPGDTILLSKDGSGNITAFINGPPVRNARLNFFYDLHVRTGKIWHAGIYPPVLGKSGSAGQFRDQCQQVNTVYKKRLLFCDSVFRISKPGIEFEKLARTSIAATYAEDLLVLFRNNRGSYQSDTLYKKSFQLLEQQKFNSLIFLIHASLQTVNFYFGNGMSFEIADSEDFEQKYNYISANYKGLFRDYLLARCAYTARLAKIRVSPQYEARLSKECRDHGYYGLSQKGNDGITNAELAKGKKNAVITTRGQTQTLNDIISGTKETLIYIDFWASWCAPCRAEMPHSKQLAKRNVNRSIRFLYVSIDRNNTDWQNACKAEELTGNNSVLLLDPDNADFVKKNSITSIPRYFLINKKTGEVWGDAPRPGEKKIQQLIDKYLLQ